MPKTLISLAILFLFCPLARPATIQTVSFDTSSLVAHPAGPFYFYAVLLDGDGFGDGNNTATLTNFDFGGGSALGSPTLVAGASGSLSTGVTITTTSFLSIFSQQFAPGLHLNLTLALTSNDDLGGTPDGLAFFIVDSFGVPIPTLAPSGGDYLVAVPLSSAPVIFESWGSDPSRALTIGDPGAMPAAAIVPVNAVPEPPAWTFLSLGLVASVVLSAHRWRAIS